MKLILVSRWMTWAHARLIEILRSISSPSKSVGQVPSSIRPARVVTPAACRSEATSVVFPTVLWPTTATLRRFGAENDFMAPDYIEGLAQPRAKRTHKNTAAAAKTIDASNSAAATALPLLSRSSGCGCGCGSSRGVIAVPATMGVE